MGSRAGSPIDSWMNQPKAVKKSLEMSTSVVGEVRLVEFRGSLDTGTSGEAESLLLGEVRAGHRKLLVDFDALDYVSSAGLRILLLTSKKLSSSGGELRLCNLNDIVQEIFDISGFSTIFKVYDDRSAALEGF